MQSSDLSSKGTQKSESLRSVLLLSAFSVKEWHHVICGFSCPARSKVTAICCYIVNILFTPFRQVAHCKRSFPYLVQAAKPTNACREGQIPTGSAHKNISWGQKQRNAYKTQQDTNGTVAKIGRVHIDLNRNFKGAACRINSGHLVCRAQRPGKPLLGPRSWKQPGRALVY